MAELTPLYMDISGVYSGDELGLPYRDIMGEGVVGSGDLAVTQHAGAANLSVDVAAGAAWVLGDTDTNAQPCYRVRNDAVVNKGITPDPSNPRKVIIVAQITDATFSGASRAWAITAIHGAPNAAPVEPTLPASALKLAVITVPAGATTIVTANIADARVRASVGGGQAVASGELDYKEITASVVVSGTSAAQTPIITGGSVVYDGATTVIVEFYAPEVMVGASDQTVLELWEDGVDIGALGTCTPSAQGVPARVARRLTPTAGAHTFAVKAWRNAANGSVQAGPGGAITFVPAFLRITRA